MENYHESTMEPFTDAETVQDDEEMSLLLGAEEAA
jgi:hypothetical protein